MGRNKSIIWNLVVYCYMNQIQMIVIALRRLYERKDFRFLGICAFNLCSQWTK